MKGTHLPVTVKELQTGYLSSPYFKDLYLVQIKLSSTKAVIHKVQMLAEKYVLLDSLLFKLVTIPEKESALLAIPETCADQIIPFTIQVSCGSSRSNEDIFNHRRQVLHTRFNTLTSILYKGLPHTPIN